jgi:hypothetical protein
MKMIFIVSLSLLLLATADPLVAAELSGTVYNGGVPAANLEITVEGRRDTTRTDSKGQYKFDLPPGNYSLIIRDKKFPVTVASGGTKQDIRF